ncbi:MAG TPA: hypothetical protein VHW64_19930 [Nocardioides sp.]|jgi:hypothetical protein|uniref:hypothetical protein n=1 Tax=Nocardioides sp. TaxID=35761 RepID=UPI002E331BB5|nr:hypothetical protein [Nocardioides sp.]HEX3932966.1 hypothetical protein [Nocardioides sp.]
MTDERVVERALRSVLRDHGWRVVQDRDRLRAMLSDVLGVDATENRGLVDALVVAADHGVLDDLASSTATGHGELGDVQGQLESWGLSTERAQWAVATWASVLPSGTDPAPTTDPAPPRQPQAATPVRPLVTNAAIDAEMTAAPPAATALPPMPPRATVPGPAPRPGVGIDRPRGWLRSRTGLVAACTVGALAVAGGGFVALAHPFGGHAQAATTDAAHRPTPMVASATMLMSDHSLQPRPLAHPVGMAAEKVGVSLTSLSEVSQVQVGGHTMTPPPGGRLITFGLGPWACQDHASCGHGHDLGVEVGGQSRTLRGSGPYVVAVPADTTSADLVLSSEGVDQRISLLTGQADAGNIQVLERQHRDLTVNRHFVVTTATSIPIYYIDGQPGLYHHTLDVTVADAHLDYFVAGQTPHDPSRAFLFVRSWYTRSEDPDKKHEWAFDEPALTFVARDGTVYHASDLTEKKSYATQVFEVPASLQGGQFVIGGPHVFDEKATNGRAFTLTIAQHTERFAF